MNINKIVKYIEDKLHKKYVLNEETEWVYVEIINIDRIDVKIVSDRVFTEKEVKNYLEELINKITIDDNIKLYIGHVNLSSVDEAEFLDLKKPSKRKLQNPSFSELIDANLNNIDLSKVDNINTSRIISFYSYKGGVGRTIALIQTAYLLAKEGKNVLLMDLDIEAPSFYNIFKDDIKTEFGLVDYLYEDLYFDNKTISVSNIISKLNLELKGDIYLIPAGRNNLNYVKRLEKLKEKRIYENKSIQNVIRETEQKYSIDYTLVDSRTGINNWGALSLLDISDEVMLFAYPNRENIEGIKLILDLIKAYKNPTIVLSRIDASNEGEKIAKSLFEELNINQEYIPIRYDSEIALAQKYPIDNVTKPYEEITNFILEKEKNAIYKSFISSNKNLVNDILNELSNIDSLNNIVTMNEEKILNQSNWIVISDEQAKDIINRVNKHIDVIDSKSLGIKISNKNDIWKKDEVVSNILNVLNIMFNHKKDSLNMKYNNKFINYDLKKFEMYLKENKNKASLKCVVDYIDSFNNEYKINTVYCIDLEALFEEIDNEYMDLVITLFSFVEACDINLKLVINKNYYYKYEREFNDNNSSILDLSWRENKNSLDRIEEFLDKSINILKDDTIFLLENNLPVEIYRDNKLENNKLLNEGFKNSIKGKLNEDIFNLIGSELKTKNKSSESFGIAKENILKYLLINDSILDKDNESLSEFIYGKRVDSSRYSKYISKWIYEELIKIDSLDKKNLIKLISGACKIESENGDYNKTSIITYNSFLKALNLI